MSLVERLRESGAYLFIEKRLLIPLDYRRQVSSYQTLLKEALGTGAVSQGQLDFLSNNPKQEELALRLQWLRETENHEGIEKIASQLSAAQLLDLERRRVEYLGVIKNLIELYKLRRMPF